MRYLGLDPGVGGGLAALDHNGALLGCTRMPDTERDVYDWLAQWQPPQAHSTQAVIEFVRSSPQMGVVSAFTFGRNYGSLLMVLTALAIPFTEVTPLAWQTALGCRSQRDKHVTKRRAQQLFPGVKVTLFTADALLLSEFCRRQAQGRLSRKSA